MTHRRIASMDLRKPRPALTLAKVLKMRNPHQFREALVNLAIPYGTGHVPLPERPELVRMIAVLDTLHTDARVSGIWHFLVAPDALIDVPAAQEWCRRIGADRTTAYLAEAIALFPKGRLPQSQARRKAWVRRLEYTSPDPLREIDRKYEGAVEEMIDLLRVYIRVHVEEFEQAFAAPIPEIPIDEQAEFNNALIELQQVGDNLTAERQERVRKAQQKRKTLGLGGIFSTGVDDDPRRIRFLEEIAALTLEQWVAVIDRWMERLRSMRRAMVNLPSIWFNILQGEVYPPQETKRRKAADERARARAEQILAALPESLEPTRLNLRKTVKWIVNQALIIFSAPDEIMADKSGERAARTILSVFEGFITMPI